MREKGPGTPITADPSAGKIEIGLIILKVCGRRRRRFRLLKQPLCMEWAMGRLKPIFNPTLGLRLSLHQKQPFVEQQVQAVLVAEA